MLDGLQSRAVSIKTINPDNIGRDKYDAVPLGILLKLCILIYWINFLKYQHSRIRDHSSRLTLYVFPTKTEASRARK